MSAAVTVRVSTTQLCLENRWLQALLLVLLGYAVFDKGFAYLFLGEALLVTGILIFLRSTRFSVLFSDPVVLLWLIFAGWGAYRTLPFLSQYGVQAVRDAVLWGYGFLVVALAAFLDRAHLSRASIAYKKFLIWFLPLYPVLLLFSEAYRDLQPTIPWSDGVPVLFIKAGDIGVHLAGAALFLLIFASPRRAYDAGSLSVSALLRFMGWSLAFVFVAISNRSGLLAIILPLLLLTILRMRGLFTRVALLCVMSVILVAGVLGSDLISVQSKGRSFTLDQVSENLGSIVGSGSAANTEGTKQWRLVWWGNIVRDTVFGLNFWSGRGFGVNLFVEYGPTRVASEDVSVRSPHNGSITVLARMGVVGLGLWIALNGLFGVRLFLSYRRSMRRGLKFWSNLQLWVLCYWSAAFINMSFDVYLEGPQGGFWFWSLMGVGVAAMRLSAREEPATTVAAKPPAFAAAWRRSVAQ